MSQSRDSTTVVIEFGEPANSTQAGLPPLARNNN
jgi:hypothetical protein